VRECRNTGCRVKGKRRAVSASVTRSNFRRWDMSLCGEGRGRERKERKDWGGGVEGRTG
jgi:hypothetical protein